MTQLDPKLDVVFKLLFTKKIELLKDMLQGVLGRQIEDLKIKNPEIPGSLSTDKAIILDIRVHLADGARVDVEMQMRAEPGLTSRLVYYVARDFTDQLEKGKDYDTLTPTIGIVWLVQPLFKDLQQLHSVFELRERTHHRLFSEDLSIHVLQLAYLQQTPETDPAGHKTTVHRWARFFSAKDEQERKLLASEDPVMVLANKTLDDLSQDPEAKRLARERADAQKFHQIEKELYRQQGHEEGMVKGIAKGKAEGRAEGKAEGRAEGMAKLLLQLIETRFNHLTDETKARIQSAEPQELELWAKRILTAKTLDEIFEPT